MKLKLNTRIKVFRELKKIFYGFLIDEIEDKICIEVSPILHLKLRISRNINEEIKRIS